MRFANFILAAAVATAFAPVAPALAQSSEDDLLKRFKTHQSTHRGLSLSPVSSAGATAAGSAKATQAATSSATSNTATTAPEPATTTTSTASTGTTVKAASTSQAATPEVEYVRMPADSQINITIEFDFNSAQLRASEFAKLETLCNAIKRSDVGLFHIFGHTDASGSDSYNLSLSRLRAEEVRRRMINDCAIEGDRLRAIGVGEQYLLLPTDPNAPANRRVEFQAVS